MSASPAGPSPSGMSDGKTPPANGQNGQIRRMKPRPAADPLRMNSRKPIRPAGSLRAPPIRTKTTTSGLQAPAKSAASILATPSSFAIPKNQGPGPELERGPAVAQTTFSEGPQGPYKDFPLVTTKRALREGIRFHVARFSSKREVDLTSQDEFVRPVSLHRRDPRQIAGKDVKPEPEEVIDDKEKERQEIAAAEKARQRAADLAQIAPSGNNAAAMAQKRNQAFRNEKTTQIYRLDKTEADRKQSELRYEEALPWHLEDAETKQTWVGSYESALSDTNVILVAQGDGFKMIPIEKWYKFTAKNQFKPMTIEEAEEQMKKKSKPTRWAMHDEEKQVDKRAVQETRKALGGVYQVKKESASFKNSGKRELEDADDLDFAHDDLFQDDDEQATVEPENDEETKNVQDKIKREQMGANLFGEADENEIEKELEREEAEEEARKKLGKGTKKALKKREKNYLYESDSSNNDPFEESGSSSDTSDDEKTKEDDRRKDEEAKLKAKAAGIKLPSGSGSSSKGTNTPSKVEKHSDPLKKSSSHLKRPGSPNLSASEASGSESARKKQKKKHGLAHSASRHMSPASGSASPSRMSDGDTEMSETSKLKKKFKIKIGGASPVGSRAGSPTGSRAASPAITSPSASFTAQEIVAAMPPGGISIGDLIKLFPRVTDKDTRSSFIKLVKDVASFGPDKLLRPKQV